MISASNRAKQVAMSATIPYVLDVPEDEDPYKAGIIAKLRRATELVEQLQAEQANIRHEQGEDPHQLTRTDNINDVDDPVVQIEWRLAVAPDPVPLSFAALLGDVIHNLRASLDYCAWAAVSEAVRVAQPHRVSFPLFSAEAAYEAWLRGAPGWFDEATLEVMRAIQPFHAQEEDEGAVHPLRVLQVLSNTDKHRLLNVIEDASIGESHQLDPEPAGAEWWAASGPIRVGQLTSTLRFPRPADSLDLRFVGNFQWYECVAYEEPGEPTQWLRLDHMVEAISSFTLNTVGLMAGARLGIPPDPGALSPEMVDPEL